MASRAAPAVEAPAEAGTRSEEHRITSRLDSRLRGNDGQPSSRLRRKYTAPTIIATPAAAPSHISAEASVP